MFILLDIDGVMVPAASWKAPNLLEAGFAAFKQSAVMSLNKIIAETNATIILMSSHRDRYSNAEWQEIFSNRGIAAKIQKCDIRFNTGVSRRDLISQWFNTNEAVKNFVIIDDDKSLNDLSSDLKQNLVLTDSLVGLTEALAEIVIERLKAKEAISKFVAA